jgi:radical SAM superfamily enzyme YgiQ (UPF0313 family)
VPLRSSVGCPYRCEFCDFVVLHPKVLLRSAASIVEELEHIARRGARSVTFVDDNAFTSKARIADLAGAMIESELGLMWGGFLRADKVTDENVELLGKAGLRYAWFGIESGDPEILRRMNKRCDLEAAQRGINRLASAGVHVLTHFIVGFPGETPASVDRSIAFLGGLNRNARGYIEYIVFPFIVFPGARVDRPDRRREYGLSGVLFEWQHDTMTSAEVRSSVAPRFFKQVELAYNYYAAEDSPLWSVNKRNAAISARKALTVAFLDHLDDQKLQEAFAALFESLRFGKGKPPAWNDLLAPRELQPGP